MSEKAGNTILAIMSEIMADDVVNNSEAMAIRDKADELFDQVRSMLGSKGENSNVSAFQKSCDVSTQLIQNSFFDLKKVEMNNEQKECVKNAFENQLAYMLTHYYRFFNSL